MTTDPAPARRPLSTPILAAALRWSAFVTVPLAVLAAVAGWLAAGGDGLWSALSGVLVGALFLAITALSILIANRWFGDPLYVPIFFGIVLGGWILKLVVFIVVLLVVRTAEWLVPPAFFLALVAAVLAALAVDVIVMLRMRLPYASDVTLPGEEGDSPSAPAAGAGS